MNQSMSYQISEDRGGQNSQKGGEAWKVFLLQCFSAVVPTVIKIDARLTFIVNVNKEA